MRPYLDLCARILSEGEARPDRTGTGTIAIFGHQMRFDLADGFPLVTTKKLHWKSIVYELLWFLKGDTNVAYLNKHNVRIWDEWADENGDLGPVYGRQWRAWPAPDGQHIDQIANLVAQIKRDPASRRQVVSAWNVAELPAMALVPCHCLWHTAVLHGRLHMQLYQRSGDVFLGVPFNIASYALLLAMLAQQCDLEPGEFIWTGGDCHIYANHVEQVRLQMTRDPYPLPKLNLRRKPASIFDYAFEDFELLDYQAHPHIKGAVAV